MDKKDKEHLEHLNFIKNIKQFEQKSKEWLNQRYWKLTSSDAATALGINPYKKPVQLLLEKCGAGRSFTGNESTLHGQKYEDEAVNKYAYLMGKENNMFGMISFSDLDPIRKNKKYVNKDYHFLGGSPDGIAIDKSNLEKLVMLEVKCPMRRKIKHGQIPDYYYPQVQLNMFILDLEIADFVEYIPEPKVELNIVRIHRNEEWFDKNFCILQNFWNEVLLWRTRDIKTHPDYFKYAVLPNQDIPKILNSPDFLFIHTDEERPVQSSESVSLFLDEEEED
jgi:putative phage-type endonuclease